MLKKDEKKGSSVYNDEHVHFPIESYRTDSHGRSIRATRDIAQGELVFKDTRNTVVFTDAHSYRGYLYAIKEDTTFNDPGAACDLLKYSWAQKRVGTEEYVVMLNLDDGALMIDDDEVRRLRLAPRRNHVAIGILTAFGAKAIVTG